MPTTNYPNVVCDRHPNEEPKPGFAVCVHVLDGGAEIGHMVTPPRDGLGHVLCFPCLHEYQSLDSLRLVCWHCVKELLEARGL